MTGRNKTYKTPAYKQYQEHIREYLRGTEWPFKDMPVSFYVEAGLSNRAADIDNVIKPLLDTFQVIYDDFNDNKVYYVELQKKIVPKGDEYIRVRVGTFNSGTIRAREDLLEESPNLKSEKEQEAIIESET